jgi:hypothetical protein
MSERFRLGRAILASAAYGFAIGAVHSWRYAAHNLVKFPLLLVVTALVCAAAHYLVARAVAPRLPFLEVARLVTSSYADTAVLLASLGSVCLFLALAFEPPSSTVDLGEYPLFLGLNVLLIAICGSIALGRQALELLGRHRVSRGRTRVLVAAWLGTSLLVGSQWAWYLRPFFGNRAVSDDGSFCLGSRPDFRGATSFYEAVLHLVRPPHAGAASGVPSRGEPITAARQ